MAKSLEGPADGSNQGQENHAVLVTSPPDKGLLGYKRTQFLF